MPALSNMKRLWVHEILRVFGDRLVDEADTKWLIRQTGMTLKERMEVSMEELFEDLLIAMKKEYAKHVRSHRFSSLIKNFLKSHFTFLCTSYRLPWTYYET